MGYIIHYNGIQQYGKLFKIIEKIAIRLLLVKQMYKDNSDVRC